MDNYLNSEQKRLKDKVDSMQIILDCPLCDAHGLHVIGEGQIQTRQCLNCGYATSPKYEGKRETNEMFATLPDEMKNWSEEADGKIWIPAIITLPFGMLYPEDTANQSNKSQSLLTWAFAPMINVTEEEKKDYEVPGQPGVYYEQMYDTENAMKFETFLEGFAHLNERAKQEAEKIKAESEPQFPQEKVNDIKLPKLKKL